MRKVAVLILAAVFLFSLAGCGLFNKTPSETQIPEVHRRAAVRKRRNLKTRSPCQLTKQNTTRRNVLRSR